MGKDGLGTINDNGERFATDKPCGDFTWQNITYVDVKCDYSYYSSDGFVDYIAKRHYHGPFSGRCNVTCSDGTPVIGPPVTSESIGIDEPHNFYYCHVDSKTWLGTEPWCEEKPCGKFEWKDPENGTVICDYTYYSPLYYRDHRFDPPLRVYGGLRGRCEVQCSPPLVPTGAPLLEPDAGGYYYCHGHSATWLGQEPKCRDRPCGDFQRSPQMAIFECDYRRNGVRLTWDHTTGVIYFGAIIGHQVLRWDRTHT
ncbi:uncharacterized protein LOC118408698 [Branchiostoma floridae]|uniref:Uncharacterized protein LOC118408698 n=1 Tax=Branchiostoma floridae TaxID=7739 RepID=A0A9J7HTT3_BRAFL|nr:uncharacterized protein LOC118408698 [Branchiostoma floridae]